MEVIDKDLEEMLEYDALASAERKTGKSYKDDEFTRALGLSQFIRHNEKKRLALEAAGDVHYSSSFWEIQNLAANEGFERVLDDVFEGSSGPDHYELWWSPEGILLQLESYTLGSEAPGINNAHIYYNWEADDPYDKELWHATASGHWLGGVYVGYHDVREAFALKLNRLRESGQFLTSWVEAPFLYFRTYAERDEDYKAVTKDRLDRLPQELQFRVCHI